MKIITTKNQEILFDDMDEELLSGYSWCVSVAGYAVARDKKTQKVVYMHRLILNNPERTDHINGDRLDNRRGNLRVCTNAENARNQKIRSNNTSGYKGVSWDKRHKKWHAYIRIYYKRKHLGYFDTSEEAHKAYQLGSKQYHKEFARLV